MNRPVPSELDGARVIRFAYIDEGVTPTGNTRHFVGTPTARHRLPSATALAIAAYDDDLGVYLFYPDAGLDVMTDTYHDDVEAALSQAEFEYEGVSEAWIEVSAP